MKVVKEFDNKLLGRKEAEFFLEADSSVLSRAEAKAKVVKSLKSDENLTVVTKIKTQFGSRNVSIFAYVYENEAVMKRLTPEHIAKRNAEPEKAAAE